MAFLIQGVRRGRTHSLSPFRNWGGIKTIYAEHRTLNTSGVWPEINVVLDTAQLLNISTRLRVQSGENVLIGGFIITGTDPKKVIIRAIGLRSRSSSGTLDDPTFELRSRGQHR